MTSPLDRLAEAIKDRYVLERGLGVGGMATVYLAHDLKHDRKVAIKVLRPELAAVLGAERFVQEIRTTANLQHPNILPLFDSGEADKFLYYVMPYVDGETLRDKLNRETQLGIDEAVKITTEVAGALDYAHRQNVIHRDIKPENILLHDGRPLVADFGIALAVSAAAGGRMTETGLSLGTPHYMSPEQATADKHVTHRSDIYSLGAVLYEMLTGEPPHTGSSAQAIILKIVSDEARPVTELRKSVPPNVAAALAKALEKLPADRFESATAFGTALTNPFAAPRQAGPGIPGDVRAATWRRRTTVLAAGCVVLALLAGWGWLKPAPSGDGAEALYVPIAFANPPRARTFWSPGIALAPDGAQIAYVGLTGGWHLLDLRTGEPRSLGFGGLELAFSPNGDSLVHTTGGRLQQLYLVDRGSGRETLLADSAGHSPVWTRDGWIYFAQMPGAFRVRVSDGTRETLVHPGPDDRWFVRHVVPLENGRAILFTRIPLAPRNLAKAEVVALDLTTGDATVITNGIDARVTPSGYLLIARLDGSLLGARFETSSLAVGGPFALVLDGLEMRETSGSPGPAMSLGADGSLLYVRSAPFADDTVLVIGRNGQLKQTMPSWGGVISGLAYAESHDRWASSVYRGLTTPNVFVRSGRQDELRRLTFTEILDYYPVFVPKTGDVAFVSTTTKANWDLYRVPFDGSREPEVILDRPGDVRGPRFTADGRWVVFCEADLNGRRDVVAHRFEPDSITEILVATDAQECEPDVSPNGQWLAYTSDESGATEVYVRPFAQRTSARWQVSKDGATTPRWSRSGHELFYVNARRELVAVPVLDATSFAVGPARVLFALDERSEWSGETLVDGQEFIVIRSHQEAPGEVVLIRHFDELLRQKVGR